MPIGNGDIGLNVWVETNGAVDFYIGKTDAWSDNVQGDYGLYKLGGVRITASPNPLTNGAAFAQTLMLYQGEMQITEGSGANSVTFLIWVDANNPVIQVHASTGGTQVTFQVALNDWRLSASNPDVVHTGQTNYINWYHRNSASDDTHVANWTYGAIIQSPGLTNTSSTNLTSVAVTNQLISIYPLTTHTQTASQWLTLLQSNVTQIAGLNLATELSNHLAWWSGFWNRSWIYIWGNQSAATTTAGYVLQRFITACAGRGAYPAKFNGSIFIVENPAAGSASENSTEFPTGYSPDGRTWGGQYWFQNTRLLYWPLLESGDFDIMLPLFNMYYGQMALDESQIESYYGHGGVYFAETAPFWGGLNNVSTNAIPVGSSGLFTTRYFEGILELSMMMLDYYDYTGDTNFLANTLLPVAAAGLTFYDQQFAVDINGHMLLDPVNAIETYWDTYDPAPDIAGLTAVLPRMLALPASFITESNEAQWTRMMCELPPLPVGTSVTGATDVLLPYSGPQTNALENGENPELYAIFPYRNYGLDKTNLSLAVNSFNKRRFYGTGWADWQQDAIQAAMLGETSTAQQYTVYNMTNKDPSLKFPAFWKQQNDYLPSQDTGGVGMDALQRMIMQTDGAKIMLLPAWPAGWNAIFQLNAPYNTTVQGTISNGILTNLVVTPSSRLADVILMPGGGMAAAVPTGLSAIAANAQVALSWTESTNGISYIVKRSTINGGPYTNIATGVMNVNYIDTGLANGTTYYYVVSGQNASGASANSGQVSATPTTAVPYPPTGLIAAVGNGQVALYWTPTLGATGYNIKRSTNNDGPYTIIASGVTNANYVDDGGLAGGKTYYYVVSGVNTTGEGGNSAQVNATLPLVVVSSLTFVSGVFTNNSVLGLAGPPSLELYGVSMGDGSSHTTANGYVFGSYPGTNISYGGGGYGTGPIFLSGGGTSGDSSFDAVINNAELGINSGVLTLSNLTAGVMYNVLFLEADTRTGGESGRQFQIVSGAHASSSQTYAFAEGSPDLGGYILCNFVATGTNQIFTNTAAGYGYQLNGLLVESVPSNTPAVFTTISINSSDIGFTGANGPANGVYWVIASTNLAAPLSMWTPVLTDSFNAAGAFSNSIPMNTAQSTIFYRLIQPSPQ